MNSIPYYLAVLQSIGSPEANQLLNFTLKFKDIMPYIESIGWSVESIVSARKFLYSISLIFSCLQSDAFISKPVREKILNEMLIPK